MAHMIAEIEKLQNKNLRLGADLEISKDENNCRVLVQNVTQETAKTYKHKILQDRELMDKLCDKKDRDYDRLKVRLVFIVERPTRPGHGAQDRLR